MGFHLPLPLNRRIFIWTVLLGLIAIGSQGCRLLSSNSKPKLLAPLPQDPLVQVYFNLNQAAEYREPYRKLKRSGDDLEQILAKAISSATSTVDVAVQELRLPKIGAALVERHSQGVRVRVIVENTYSRPWSDLTADEVGRLPQRELSNYQEFLDLVDRNGDGQLSQDEIDSSDALAMLRKAEVPVLDDTADGSKGSGLMHHKFVIIDGKTAIVTSANFTTSGIHGDFQSAESMGNANNLIKIESPELATIFTEEFDILWGDGPGGKRDSKFGIQKPYRGMQQVQVGSGTIAVQFAATGRKVPWENSANGAIALFLAKARQSVDLALFVFSEQLLADELEKAHQRGVRVRSLIDPSFAYRNYSEALDMLGVALADKRCRYEDGNRPWTSPIATVGVPQLPPGDKLHHKFAILDSQVVIAGSLNWSKAANTQNDETVLAIDNPTVAAHFVREFERLYDTAQLGIPPHIDSKIKQQQKKCG